MTKKAIYNQVAAFVKKYESTPNVCFELFSKLAQSNEADEDFRNYLAGQMLSLINIPELFAVQYDDETAAQVDSQLSLLIAWQGKQSPYRKHTLKKIDRLTEIALNADDYITAMDIVRKKHDQLKNPKAKLTCINKMGEIFDKAIASENPDVAKDYNWQFLCIDLQCQYLDDIKDTASIKEIYLAKIGNIARIAMDQNNYSRAFYKLFPMISNPANTNDPSYQNALSAMSDGLNYRINQRNDTSNSIVGWNESLFKALPVDSKERLDCVKRMDHMIKKTPENQIQHKVYLLETQNKMLETLPRRKVKQHNNEAKITEYRKMGQEIVKTAAEKNAEKNTLNAIFSNFTHDYPLGRSSRKTELTQ